MRKIAYACDTVVGNNTLLTHGDLGELGVGQGDSLFHVSLSSLICCAIWWIMKLVLQMEQHPIKCNSTNIKSHFKTRRNWSCK